MSTQNHGVSMATLNSVTSLIANMAEIQRADERLSKGADAKVATDEKQEAMAAIRKLKVEVHHLKNEERKALARQDWWDPFDDNTDARFVEAEMKKGIEIERAEKKVAGLSEDIGNLQQDMKDVISAYDASHSIVDDLRRQLDTAMQAAATL